MTNDPDAPLLTCSCLPSWPALTAVIEGYLHRRACPRLHPRFSALPRPLRRMRRPLHPPVETHLAIHARRLTFLAAHPCTAPATEPYAREPQRPRTGPAQRNDQLLEGSGWTIAEHCSPIDRQAVGAAHVDHGHRLFLCHHLRRVLIECYDSVAETWALLLGMS